MPKDIQEILEHADELAERFENYEPTEADRVSVTLTLLRRAVVQRAAAEREILDAVRTARDDGQTWAQIAEILGTSTQAANRRYSELVRS